MGKEKEFVVQGKIELGPSHADGSCPVDVLYYNGERITHEDAVKICDIKIADMKAHAMTST